MGVTKKLELFSKTAIEAAEEKSESALKKLDYDFRREYRQAEETARTDVERRVHGETQKIRLEYNKALFSAKAAAKRSILERRQQMTDALFDSVRDMLDSYAANNPEYINKLNTCLKEETEKYGGGDIVIYLSSRDVPRVTPPDGVNISDGGEDMIGGFVLAAKEKGIAVNGSYAALLAVEKEGFDGIGI